MPASSAPAAKGALLDLLAASEALSGVKVTWDHPGAKASKTFVFLGDTEQTEEARQLGGGIRQENYTIEVYAVVHREGDNPQAVEERAWELVAAVQAVLSGPDGAADLGLVDGIGILSLTAQFSGVSVRSFVEDGGWTAQASPALVSVSARIR